MKYLWLATTNDAYELPVAVFDTREELARWFNVEPCAVGTAIRRKGTIKGYKVFKVNDYED